MISEFMCRPCLWKAKKAFDKGESKQTSFQTRKEEIQEDLPENIILLDSESERPHSTESTQIKNEETSDKAIQRFLGQSQVHSFCQKVWSCCTYILNKLNLGFFSSDSDSKQN